MNTPLLLLILTPILELIFYYKRSKFTDGFKVKSTSTSPLPWAVPRDKVLVCSATNSTHTQAPLD